MGRGTDSPATLGHWVTASRFRGSTRRRRSRATSSSSSRATACSSAARRSRRAAASGSPPSDPATEEPLAEIARATVEDVDQAVGVGAARLQARLGRAARTRAGQVPLPHRAHPAGAQPRVRGARVARRRQADQGVTRRRRAARRGALLVLRRLGGQARVRVPRPRPAAAGRGGAGHPVELPAADAGLEDRAGARRRQHGRPQAGQLDAAERALLRRRRAARPTCRRAWSTSSPARARSASRWSAIPTSTRSPSPARPRSARRSAAPSPARTRR